MPFQDHVLSTKHQTSRALQHILHLEAYKPFTAGEIRIRCLGPQLTCSAETMERLSKCTCSESGIQRQQELASNCQDKLLISHHMGISTLMDFFLCHLFYSIPGFKFLISPPSLLLPPPNQQEGMMVGCSFDVPLCLLCSEHKLSAAQMASFVPVQ